MWEAPDWMRRPAHYYTDDDWAFIKGIWAKEKRQGAEPRYWEDVKIGDEPTWTADGPIEESIMPTAPWGMGLGGSRTMKKEIMDPKIFKTMVRGENDGIYRLPNREDCVPPVPDDPATVPMPEMPKEDAVVDLKEIHKQTETRAVLINYFGRDIAIRHIHNWMGDHGWLYNIRWGIMAPETHAAYGKIVPVNPQAERFLEKVPKMKGKFVTAHGLTGDLAIVKSCVYDKYVRDDQFLVELGWWVETIDGYLWEEGGATVKLPSKWAISSLDKEGCKLDEKESFTRPTMHNSSGSGDIEYDLDVALVFSKDWHDTDELLQQLREIARTKNIPEDKIPKIDIVNLHIDKNRDAPPGGSSIIQYLFFIEINKHIELGYKNP